MDQNNGLHLEYKDLGFLFGFLEEYMRLGDIIVGLGEDTASDYTRSTLRQAVKAADIWAQGFIELSGLSDVTWQGRTQLVEQVGIDDEVVRPGPNSVSHMVAELKARIRQIHGTASNG